MNFGRLTDISNVDFTLPPDHPQTDEVLNKPVEGFNAFVGCSKWGEESWIGKIYKKGSKKTEFLSQYARFFNAIEHNGSLYGTPDEQVINGWKRSVAGDFTFCLKFPNVISKAIHSKDVNELTKKFSEAVAQLGSNAGPCLLWLHEKISINDKQLILDFLPQLQQFTKGVFIEFRHPAWFENSKSANEVFKRMQELNIGTVITDTAGRRDAVHMRLTIPKAFIRLVGNQLHPSDYSRVDDWAERIKNWKEKGLESLYFFIHNDDEYVDNSPELAIYSISAFNACCQTQLQVPELLKSPPETGRLFEF